MLPMYEVLLLQVFHSRGDLCGHVEQRHGIHLRLFTISQVIQQVSMWHVLCHNVERRLQCTHTCGSENMVKTNAKTAKYARFSQY